MMRSCTADVIVFSHTGNFIAPRYGGELRNGVPPTAQMKFFTTATIRKPRPRTQGAMRKIRSAFRCATLPRSASLILALSINATAGAVGWNG